MSTVRKARYVGGSMTGVDVLITLKDGDQFTLHVDPDHELPSELPDGRKVPAYVVDSLLEQEDNWSEVKREIKKAADKP